MTPNSMHCRMNIDLICSLWPDPDNVPSQRQHGPSCFAHAISLGGTVLLRRQRHILHMAEKAKRMLNSVRHHHGRRESRMNLPKCNAQAPDGLHLIARGLARSDPVAIHNLSTLLVEGVLELGAQLRSRFGNAGGADNSAVQIRKWLPNHDSDNRQGDEHQTIHTRVDEVREDVVNM